MSTEGPTQPSPHLSLPPQVRVQERERISGQERAIPQPCGGNILHPHLRPHAGHVDGAHRVLLQGQLGVQEISSSHVGRHEEQGPAGAVRRAGH